MRIAFYAPMKPPDHPTPSGDRRVARMLQAALQHSGHQVSLASRFRAYDGKGDVARQVSIKGAGEAEAERLIDSHGGGAAGDRPDLWFTYHLYHKAPDWIGPLVADALGIPYLLAEASHAPKQRHGPWAMGFDAAERAIRRADRVFSLNPLDQACVAPLLAGPDRDVALKPFLDTEPFQRAIMGRGGYRQALARQFDLDTTKTWLLCVAMMRPGDKQQSYRVLAEALQTLKTLPWQLLVVGDGAAADDIGQYFTPVMERVRRLGAVDPEALPPVYAAADIYVWPAINEAFGMAMLEAQAAGLPVVAGRSPGVAGIVRDLETGILVEAGDAFALAGAIGRLARRAAGRTTMARAAARTAWGEHGLDRAAEVLDRAIREVAP